jgi:hypothetical protein
MSADCTRKSSAAAFSVGRCPRLILGRRGLHAISHELGKILLRAISLCSQTDTTR